MFFGIWLTVALVCLVIELASPTYFFFLSFALAGTITAIVSIFTPEPALQITTFVASAVIFIGILRMFVKRQHRAHATNVNALIGTVGRVTQAIEPHKNGRVFLNGQDWAAQSHEHLPVETLVRITQIAGVHLIVEKFEKSNKDLP